MQKQFGPRSQSAMEYLMTYGWAILIVAVVLGALYQLGVFSGANYSPRAQPGSCKVFRPSGPGTTTFINLAGVCTGQLPQFVAQFGSQSSYASVPSVSNLNFGTGDFAISYWIYVNAWAANQEYGIIGKTSSQENAPGWISEASTYGGMTQSKYYINTAVTNSVWGSAEWSGSSTPVYINRWYNFVFVRSGQQLLGYQNGVYVSTANTANIAVNVNNVNSLTLGAEYAGFQGLPGQLANVQIYNTSLDASAIQSLYAEGIGGAPQVLQNLIGWWPLNGNANDYSGNNNNGVPANVVFTNTWTR